MRNDFEQRMVERVPEVVRYLEKDKEKKKVVGYGAVFYREDEAGTEFKLRPNVKERISRSAFDEALERDDARSLFNHDPNFVLGRKSAGTLRLSVDEVGLRYEVDLPDSRQDVAEAIARGDVTGSSFWFKPTKESESRDNDGNIIYTIENLELREVGPVTFPAYEATVSEMRDSKIDDSVKRHIQKVEETEDSISITFGKSEVEQAPEQEPVEDVEEGEASDLLQKQKDDDLVESVLI
jgi:HK97 family phage prohead protease